MITIAIGDITIVERKYSGGQDAMRSFEIFANDSSVIVHTNDERLLVLAALEFDSLGLNSQFVEFAAKMLGIDGEVWT